jgi:hypothetical protein
MPQPGQTADFFRQPLAEMIDLHHPLGTSHNPMIDGSE